MQFVTILPIALMFLVALVPAPGMAQDVQLPERAAAPPPKPREPPREPAADRDLPARADVPVPEPRPERADRTAEPSSPVPQQPKPPAAAPEPAGSAVPSEEMACRARLRSLGVSFEPQPAEGDASGCAMPFPVSVSSLSRDIGIEPAALVNCATAEAAARFVQGVVAPEAQRRFGSRLEMVRQVSGYVCRPRNGTSTLSEHAFGNALDFGAFVLADGREIPVSRSSDSKVTGFLRHVRAEACGPFKTVLGPGSDADHADHFHFDLAERRNGSAYCH